MGTGVPINVPINEPNESGAENASKGIKGIMGTLLTSRAPAPPPGQLSQKCFDHGLRVLTGT